MGNEPQEEKDVVGAIIKNYRKYETSLVEQLHFEVPNHPPTIGGFREEIWKQLLEQIIPKKYAIEQSVFLINSVGEVSNEVDIAIFDEMYTPYIFRKGRIKFIPIEAVAAVVQCKSETVKTRPLVEWHKSIMKLKTSRKSVARMHSYVAAYKLNTENELKTPKTTQSGTRPICILCCLQPPSKSIYNTYDLVVCACKHKDPQDKDTKNKNNNQENGEDKISVHTNKKYKKLSDWFSSLNHYEGLEPLSKDFINEGSDFNVENDKSLDEYKVYDANGKEIPLLSLNFQLNQLLMLINNPMLFPHISYVEMFEKKPVHTASKEDNDG